MNGKQLSPSTLALIAAAKARMNAKHAKQEQAQTAPAQAVSEHSDSAPMQTAMQNNAPQSNSVVPATMADAMQFNEQQQRAIDLAMQGKSICLIGAAGTGKTTVTQEIIKRLQQAAHVSPVKEATKHLNAGAPGIVVVGYTNKAVNNVKKKLDAGLQRHCITIHKLLEYAPAYYDIVDDQGNMRTTMRFEPSYHASNKLPHISTIISEESSMTSTDLWGEVIAALPNPGRTQFVFLGDLNQLPPIFGPSILGFKLLDLETVELKHVYRQALLSPIISLATAIRTNSKHTGFNKTPWHAGESMTLPHKLTETTVVDRGEHGKLTIHPWKKRVESESALATMANFLPGLIDSGKYDPAEDMILCPFNKSFGTVELNRIIANHLGRQRGALVHEIRARYQLHYLAEGDRVLFDRHDAVIEKITSTMGYAGKPVQEASLTLDRWGVDSENPMPPEQQRSAQEIMNALETMDVMDEESKNLCSHTITIYIPDLDKSETINTAGEVNKLLLGYALTVHKSQGSEWSRVFLFLHNSHARGTMLSRELVYTAVTRAKQELYIICEGDSKDGKFANSIARAADRPVITGTTLAEKAEWFKGKAASAGFAAAGDND